MRLTGALLVALALLAGCSPDPVVPNDAVPIGNLAEIDAASPPRANGAAPVATPGLAIEAEGLRLFDPANGAARPLAFGTARADLLAALAFRGPPGTGTNGECGAGPLDYASWPDGLTVYFQRAKFAGWALDGRAANAMTTASGVGVGTTRRTLEDAYAARFSQSSIGTEFAAGELYGVLDGAGAAAKITNMWAGVSCVFR